MDTTEQVWTYVSNGVKQEVYCDRHWFLFLKLNYDDNGLTDDEYEEYMTNIRELKSQCNELK